MKPKNAHTAFAEFSTDQPIMRCALCSLASVLQLEIMCSRNLTSSQNSTVFFLDTKSEYFVSA